MQQDDWAERRFYTVQDRRSGQVLYLVEEWAHRSMDPYDHPSLPPVQAVAEENGIRWLMGGLPEGESLEDLRSQRRLTEPDIVAALISVVDALASLSALEPPVVPAYLDPACIKRDRLGRWVLDYPALAHAAEARMNTVPPLGVHPVGALLFWLITGETARRTRVQVTRLQRGVPAALQFIIIKCLGKSYPSLAALRADLERAGREHEFASLAEQVGLSPRRHVPVAAEPLRPAAAEVLATTPETVAKPILPLDYRKVPLGGPYIPADDRPWSLPPRPQDGFRKYVVPSPRLAARRSSPLALLGLLSLAAVALFAVAALAPGLWPDAARPAFLRTQPPARVLKGLASAGVQLGPELPPEPPGPAARRIAMRSWPAAGRELQDLADARLYQHRPVQPAPPAPRPTAPAPTVPVQRHTQPVPEPGPVPPPAPPTAPKQPNPAPKPPAETARPPLTPPEPGSVAWMDARDGGTAVLIYLDARPAGYAYIFPHPRSPYISLGAFNAVMGRTLYWAPMEGGAIRIYGADRNFVTRDFDQAAERIWLKLTPDLQKVLGVQLISATETGFYFESRR